MNAVAYCENLTLAGRTDWRLPNVNELKSIVKETVYNPAIDTGVFPGTVASYYWSSSTYVGFPAYAWIVDFYNGSAYSSYRTNSYSVRCVSQ